ncbi:uncharacterized protein LOC117923312 [Vitis riparia]|uniref:uncharacterized protein LOC117923312 n=1 Tax=Vitis riparia TaxID=96939 RepID=UPI00155B3642|nr:uncharacterized protein LOC117923312 [Vitis riparia]
MAQLLTLRPPITAVRSAPSTRTDSAVLSCCPKTLNPKWAFLQQKLKCNGRFSCLFSNNRKQEEARKALESALGGKKDEFEKWNKEIKKREEVGGGGEAGGGGWFGWGGRFGWSNDDHFWQEAQQASLAILGIIIMYLIIAKGEVLLAVIFNPLLFALRGTRNGFNFIISRILQKVSPATHTGLDNMPKEEVYSPVSAKESVVRKWGGE